MAMYLRLVRAASQTQCTCSHRHLASREPGGHSWLPHFRLHLPFTLLPPRLHNVVASASQHQGIVVWPSGLRDYTSAGSEQ